MGPFSVTGQPNAMGGREVGGLANQLAAHMRFDDPGRSRRIAAVLERADPGSEAWPEGGRACSTPCWMAASRHCGSSPPTLRPRMPRTDRVRAALAACPFVVVSDCWPTDTTDLAHVVLPARGLG